MSTEAEEVQRPRRERPWRSGVSSDAELAPSARRDLEPDAEARLRLDAPPIRELIYEKQPEAALAVERERLRDGRSLGTGIAHLNAHVVAGRRHRQLHRLGLVDDAAVANAVGHHLRRQQPQILQAGFSDLSREQLGQGGTRVRSGAGPAGNLDLAISHTQADA